jgi:hypothetical protein
VGWAAVGAETAAADWRRKGWQPRLCRECGQERSEKHRNVAKSTEALKVEKLAINDWEIQVVDWVAAKFAVPVWVRKCFGVRIGVEESAGSEAESIEAENIEDKDIELETSNRKTSNRKTSKQKTSSGKFRSGKYRSALGRKCAAVGSSSKDDPSEASVMSRIGRCSAGLKSKLGRKRLNMHAKWTVENPKNCEAKESKMDNIEAGSVGSCRNGESERSEFNAGENWNIVIVH